MTVTNATPDGGRTIAIEESETESKAESEDEAETEAELGEARSLALRLFGSVHLDRASKVADELDEFAGDCDALFLEYPRGMSFRSHAESLLKNPLLLVGVAFHFLLLAPLHAAMTRRVLPMEFVVARRFGDDHDVPVHPVDRHPLQILNDGRRRWWLANWLLVALFALRYPVAVAATAGILIAAWLLVSLLVRWSELAGTLAAIPGTWGVLWVAETYAPFWGLFAASAFVFFLVALGRTLSERNEVMLDQVEEIESEEGYGDACLITGKGHLSGLVGAAADRALAVTRTYRPKWLRYGGDVTESPEPSDDGGDERSLTDRPRANVHQRPVLRRIVASVLDAAFALVFALFAVGVLMATLSPFVADDTTFVLVALVTTPFVYYVGLESAFGQSLGKRLAGLVVVTEDGGAPSRRALVIRNLLRPVDFLVCYALGILVMRFSTLNQRLGDHAAGTVVARTE